MRDRASRGQDERHNRNRGFVAPALCRSRDGGNLRLGGCCRIGRGAQGISSYCDGFPRHRAELTELRSGTNVERPSRARLYRAGHKTPGLGGGMLNPSRTMHRSRVGNPGGAQQACGGKHCERDEHAGRQCRSADELGGGSAGQRGSECHDRSRPG